MIKKRRRTSEDGSERHRSGNAIARNIAVDLQGVGGEGPRSGRGPKAQRGDFNGKAAVTLLATSRHWPRLTVIFPWNDTAHGSQVSTPFFEFHKMWLIEFWCYSKDSRVSDTFDRVLIKYKKYRIPTICCRCTQIIAQLKCNLKFIWEEKYLRCSKYFDT